MNKYAYMRVSTTDQCLDRQIEAIRNYTKGSIPQENCFADKASGKDFDRAEYQRLKGIIQPGDELIIKELDRLGRNKDAIKDELKWFSDRKIVVRILDLPTSLIEIPSGQEWILDMVNNILIEVLSAMAEQERIKTLTRQREGIQAAQERGVYTINRKGGKSKKAVEPVAFEECFQLWSCGLLKQKEAASKLGISQQSVNRRFAERERVGEGYNPNVALSMQGVVE